MLQQAADGSDEVLAAVAAAGRYHRSPAGSEPRSQAGSEPCSSDGNSKCGSVCMRRVGSPREPPRKYPSVPNFQESGRSCTLPDITASSSGSNPLTALQLPGSPRGGTSTRWRSSLSNRILDPGSVSNRVGQGPGSSSGFLERADLCVFGDDGGDGGEAPRSCDGGDDEDGGCSTAFRASEAALMKLRGCCAREDKAGSAVPKGVHYSALEVVVANQKEFMWAPVGVGSERYRRYRVNK